MDPCQSLRTRISHADNGVGRGSFGSMGTVVAGANPSGPPGLSSTTISASSGSGANRVILGISYKDKYVFWPPSHWTPCRSGGMHRVGQVWRPLIFQGIWHAHVSFRRHIVLGWMSHLSGSLWVLLLLMTWDVV